MDTRNAGAVAILPGTMRHQVSNEGTKVHFNVRFHSGKFTHITTFSAEIVHVLIGECHIQYISTVIRVVLARFESGDPTEKRT